MCVCVCVCGNPSFHFHAQGSKRRCPRTQQHRLSQNIPPVCSSFVLVIASDMHLEPESEIRAKNVDFHTAKNIQLQPTRFRYFETNSYQLTSDLFTVVRPVSHRHNASKTLSSDRLEPLLACVGRLAHKTLIPRRHEQRANSTAGKLFAKGNKLC